MNLIINKNLKGHDSMVDCIVASVDEERMVAIPQENVDINSLKNKKVKYIDSNGKEWHGKVIDVDNTDQFVIIKFDEFPNSIGQGQIVEIEE